MREFNALGGYPVPKTPRNVAERTIKNKIEASYRDARYFDGDRASGYGGFKYDGRWKQFVELFSKEYGINENTKLLQLNIEKGFFLHDFLEKFPGMKVQGYEMSEYSIEHSLPSVKPFMKLGEYRKLPYQDHEFDFVIALCVVYTLTLRDAIACLKEIQRVGKGKSFITLAAFHNAEGERLFRRWSVLGATILHVDEWVQVLNEAGYTGDYTFFTAESLHLVDQEIVKV